MLLLARAQEINERHPSKQISNIIRNRGINIWADVTKVQLPMQSWQFFMLCAGQRRVKGFFLLPGSFLHLLREPRDPPGEPPGAQRLYPLHRAGRTALRRQLHCAPCQAEAEVACESVSRHLQRPPPWIRSIIILKKKELYVNSD